MTTPTRLDTPENWDAASESYAERVAPLLMESFAGGLVDRLDVDEKTEALEVAAGSGALTAHLAPRVKTLLATDFSPKMIDGLEKRMGAAGATNVTCAVMDGQALEVEDASFDRAACSFALMLFPDRAKGFAELHRALRPGGRAMVSGWAGPDKFEGFALFLGAMRAAFPETPPPPETPPVFTLADPVSFRAQMESAGFEGVEVDFVSRELELEGFDELWAMFTSGAPPVRALLGRVGPDGKTRLHDALAAIVEQRFGSGPIRTTNQATVGHGTKRS